MSFQAQVDDSFDVLVSTFTDMSMYDTIYDMTEPLQAVKHVGMDIIFHILPVKRIINWIANTDHDFPKSRKRWENLINTQFAVYPINQVECKLFSPDITTDMDGRPYDWYMDKHMIVAVVDTDQIIRLLISLNVLHPSVYGRRLRANVFRARHLAL